MMVVFLTEGMGIQRSTEKNNSRLSFDTYTCSMYCLLDKNQDLMIRYIDFDLFLIHFNEIFYHIYYLERNYHKNRGTCLIIAGSTA